MRNEERKGPVRVGKGRWGEEQEIRRPVLPGPQNRGTATGGSRIRREARASFEASERNAERDKAPGNTLVATLAARRWPWRRAIAAELQEHKTEEAKKMGALSQFKGRPACTSSMVWEPSPVEGARAEEGTPSPVDGVSRRESRTTRAHTPAKNAKLLKGIPQTAEHQDERGVAAKPSRSHVQPQCSGEQPQPRTASRRHPVRPVSSPRRA